MKSAYYLWSFDKNWRFITDSRWNRRFPAVFCQIQCFICCLSTKFALLHDLFHENGIFPTLFWQNQHYNCDLLNKIDFINAIFLTKSAFYPWPIDVSRVCQTKSAFHVQSFSEIAPPFFLHDAITKFAFFNYLMAKFVLFLRNRNLDEICVFPRNFWRNVHFFGDPFTKFAFLRMQTPYCSSLHLEQNPCIIWPNRTNWQLWNG